MNTKSKKISAAGFLYDPLVHTEKQVNQVAHQVFLEIAYDLGTEDSQDDEAQDALRDRLSDMKVPDDIIENVLVTL